MAIRQLPPNLINRIAAGEVVERHATSKLKDDNLSHILTLGFRGEALPSIAAIARLTIASRARGADQAHEIAVDGGRKGQLKPAAIGEGTRIEVRDRGPGIPLAESERVFELFRTMAQGDRGQRGTGLGLAIARGMLRAHGGDVLAFRNADGIGACLRISLPPAPEAPLLPEEDAS